MLGYTAQDRNFYWGPKEKTESIQNIEPAIFSNWPGILTPSTQNCL